MEVKFNVNLTSLNQSSAGGGLGVRGANLSVTEAQNLTDENSQSRKSGSENSAKFGVFGSVFDDASNLIKFEKGESQSSLDVLKKQLEILQKRLKELESAIKKANASKNPYAKDVAASLETQKGAVFARIMQISAQILQMQAGEKGQS